MRELTTRDHATYPATFGHICILYQLTTAPLRLHDAEELEDTLAVLDDVVLQHGRRELSLRARRLGGRRGGGAADEAVGADGGDPLQLRQGLPELKENTA